MRIGRRSLARRLALPAGVLVVVVVAIAMVLFMSDIRSGSGVASALGGGPEMALNVASGAASCDAGSCDVGTGSTFTLAVDVATRPAAGYVLLQSYLDFGVFDPATSEDGAGPDTCGDGIDNGGAGDGGDRLDADCVTVDLTYTPAAQASDEIAWLDLEPDTAVSLAAGPGLLFHGALTAVVPPLPVSTFEGNVVAVLMMCPAYEVTSLIRLLPEGDAIAQQNGSLFVEPDGVTHVVPKVGSLVINCLDLPTPTPAPVATPTPAKQPDPGDSDGDGCSDQRENGPDETLGGRRDYLNPWDFYDVVGAGAGPRDQIIDLPNDILGVIQHFSPTGVPPYDSRFDRGPQAGANPWNISAPDGAIDLPNDILGVIHQFNHDCG